MYKNFQVFEIRKYLLLVFVLSHALKFRISCFFFKTFEFKNDMRDVNNKGHS